MKRNILQLLSFVALFIGLCFLSLAQPKTEYACGPNTTDVAVSTDINGNCLQSSGGTGGNKTGLGMNTVGNGPVTCFYGACGPGVSAIWQRCVTKISGQCYAG